MRSFIRELVHGVEVFFPMAVFCFILSLLLMKDVSPKPIVSKAKKEIVVDDTKDMLCLSKQQEPGLYLFFEQMTR